MSSSGTSFDTLGDEQLLGLLKTEADRLSREAVDEIVRRGDRMVEPLAGICADDSLWEREDETIWAPVHATYILAAIGGGRVVGALIDALRRSDRHDLEWVSEYLPSMFARIGHPAVGPLKDRVADREAEVPERALAVDCLVGVAAANPVERGEVLDFLRGVAEDEGEDRELRVDAANGLLVFARPGDRKVIVRLAKLQLGENEPLFTPVDVERAYSRGGQETHDLLGDWLEFYEPEAIRERARRWREEEEDERWARAAAAQEPWVARELHAFLSRYDSALADLPPPEREAAMELALAMIAFALGDMQMAPWRWAGVPVANFIVSYIEQNAAGKPPSHFRSLPDFVGRYVRFCESEGKLGREDLDDAEKALSEGAPRFVDLAVQAATVFQRVKRPRRGQ